MRNIVGLKLGWKLAKKRRKKENNYQCMVCKKMFRRTGMNRSRVKCCSRTCRNAYIAKIQTGKQHKDRTGITIKCLYCGKEKYICRSAATWGNGRYCSFKCRKADGKYVGLRASDSPNWRGGKTELDGYIYVKKHGHPNSNSSGYVAEHRYIMSEILKRPIRKNEHIHHRNGIRNDNRPENLEVVLNGDHFGTVVCPHCSRSFKIK